MNLKILLAQNMKKPSELANYLGVTRSCVSRWISKNHVPKKYSDAVAEFFNVSSLSEVLQEQYEKDTRSIYEIIIPMTKEQKINVIQFILGML